MTSHLVGVCIFLLIRLRRCELSYASTAAIPDGVNHVNGVLIIYAAKWRREPRRKLEPEDGPDGERGEGKRWGA